MAEPVVAPVYRAFPRCLYQDGTMILVHDADAQDAKIEQGWSLTPYPPVQETTPEPAEILPEEVPAEPTSSAAPKKRGRPPKRQPAQE